MTELGKIARLIRSKNAGPFDLTFDIMFDEQADFDRVRHSKVLTAETFSKLYRVHLDDVRYFEYDAGRAIKFSIPRPYSQGCTEDGDCYGGQQYGPLVTLEIP